MSGNPHSHVPYNVHLSHGYISVYLSEMNYLTQMVSIPTLVSEILCVNPDVLSQLVCFYEVLILTCHVYLPSLCSTLLFKWDCFCKPLSTVCVCVCIYIYIYIYRVFHDFRA